MNKAPLDINQLPPNDVLRRIYQTSAVLDEQDKPMRVHSHIRPEYASALYRTVREKRPECVVEVGMCLGLSSLSILTALAENGTGKLVSIDPYQTKHERGVGALNVERAGLSSLHQLIEKPSHEVLPELLSEKGQVDFAYIDGWHTFDYVLVDFFYLDKLLPVGGVVVFNDCGWRSVHKALKFVRTHRKYKELDVGLPSRYTARNPLFSLIKRLEGRRSADRYFEKLQSWEPTANYFARF